MGVEMLRGVYTERSECAQHDRAVTHTDAWTNLFICIIAPTADLSALAAFSALQMNQ